ncbi:MAG TPA: CBS domain-containing protein [Gemmatimonadales bacterium]|nr:CBS domain-containing protein [Gemmatimonadales bacterium]
MATLRDILARKGRDVIAVGPADTVLHAANLMNEKGIGGLLVLEAGEPVGIFTERDVLRRVVAQGREPAATAVAEVMSAPVTTCEPDLSLEDGAALMTARRIRHLPVQEGGRLAGVVTIGDLLAYQVNEQRTTIAQMTSYLYDLR